MENNNKSASLGIIPIVCVLCIFIFVVAALNTNGRIPIIDKPRVEPKAHWLNETYWAKGNYRGFLGVKNRLVCDNNSKVIAEIHKASENDAFEVFGGDGASYGEYMEYAEAVKKAEHIHVINSDGRGSNHNFCE